MLLRSLGVDALAASPAPLRDAAATVSSSGWLQAVVVVAAAAATLGALLALIAGVGRTVLAMAREGDLPRRLAAVHERYAVPHVAEVAIAAVVCVLVLVSDLRAAIGFSSFGVLTYYAVANASALTQQPPHRRYPRFVPVLGLLGCVVLALAVPAASLVAGLPCLPLASRAARRAASKRLSRPPPGSRNAPGDTCYEPAPARQ